MELDPADGLDELSTTGVTHVAELKDGAVQTFEVTPGDAGLPAATGVPATFVSVPAERVVDTRTDGSGPMTAGDSHAIDLDADLANLTGLAAGMLLVKRPAALEDVGFQLSFAAVLGIVLLGPTRTRSLLRSLSR